MYRKAFAFLLAAAPLAAAPLAAQTPVRAGQTVTGTLETGDPETDGAYYDTYTITGRPGDRVLVRMRSQDFDTYLRWGREENGEWEETASNDDGGEGTDSRLVVTLGAAGEYQLRAAAFGEGEEGAYELQLSEAMAPRSSRLRAGESVQGTLTDDDYEGENGFEDHYVLAGRSGDVVTLFVASDDFDTYVSVGDWTGGGFQERESNDDGGEDTNSQLVVEMQGREAYVIVRSFSGESGGAYTLRVEPGAIEPEVDEEDLAVPEDVEIDADVEEADFEHAELAGTLVGPVQAGALVRGALGEDGDDGNDGEGLIKYYRDYSYRAAAGERLTIHMEAEEVDSYVAIGRGRGDEFSPLGEDDDGGEGLDSRLEFEVPEAGTYTIRVTSAMPGQVGPFMLRVERDQ